MFTTKKEPTRLFLELRKCENAKFLDEQMQVIPFLKEQYEYEMQRTPKHKSFENTYKLPYFNPSHMLNYYMNPWGNEKEQYAIDENPMEYRPIIMKRTLN